jgi:serine/threonine protein kinase
MIAIGTQFGSYQITSLLGQGGMGEVYRAADTKLNRDVALKFLPAQFTSDPDRMERFQREAYVLASLNHSNIAAIYGLEESNRMRALVIELVEGPTLADRIAQGPLPIDEILQIAKQIAEALEYAHERSIIHRDLKPANIKLTAEGKVKVLDFGLAKAMTSDAQTRSLSNSPTLSLAPTQAGVILGTAAYMSPEQAKGKLVDRRADIWAFGVVVYEMLTGSPMFSGETASETMAHVMMKEPDWNALPAGTPAGLRDLLRRCLTKDPRNRIRDIGDVRIAIEETITNPELQSTPETIRDRAVPVRRGGMFPWAVASILGISLVLVAWVLWPRLSTQQVMRLVTELGTDAFLYTTGLSAGASAAILSPDGKTLAFIASKTGSTGEISQLYLRPLDQLKASPIAGTDGAAKHFFSPDGQWIAFFANGLLKKVSVSGGAAVTLCETPTFLGGSWSEDGFIVFAQQTSGLFRVSDGGGTPEALTKRDGGEITQRWPQVLPGGNAVLFTSASGQGNYEDADIVVQSLKTGEKKILQRGGFYARYVPTGHVIYVRQSTIFAAPFDLAGLELTAPPVPVLEGVMSSSGSGASEYAFSNTGTFVYVAGTGSTGAVPIYWMDQKGQTTPLRTIPDRYLNLSFSPDGARLAMQINARQNDIWVYELARDAMSRLTFDAGSEADPVWTPDGRRIAFGALRASQTGGPYGMYWVRADQSEGPQRLTESQSSQRPRSWHPSGKFLAYMQIAAAGSANADTMILPMEGDESSGWKPAKPIPFLTGPFTEAEPAFSPDGRWLAYHSNETGAFEIYARPFPGPGAKVQISTGGGVVPMWSRNGKELFYRTLDGKIMVVQYKIQGDALSVDKPRLWSEGQLMDAGANRTFDLHPDGQRFAVLKLTQTEAKLDNVILILNFFDELRRLAPTRK